MIRIVHVVGQALNQLKHVSDEVVIHAKQIIHPQPLYACHLVHELEQQAMKSPVVVPSTIDQLDHFRKAALFDHLLECRLVESAVEEEEVGYDVECTGLLLLQKAIDDLGADIFLIARKDLTLEKELRAVGDIILVVQEVVATGGDQV